jgi:hypothetical protein
VEYFCSLIKVDWLAACIAPRVVGDIFVVFPRRWRKNLHNPPANAKKEERVDSLRNLPNPADQ